MRFKECWVPIPGFLNYLISNTGFVYSVRSEIQLIPGVTDGYLHVQLGKRNHRYIHCLVAEVFIGSIPEGYEVNHIDGIKSNNHVCNLEIITPVQNVMHAYKLGLRPASRFSPKKVCLLETGEIFESVSSMARYLNVSPQAVDQAIRRNSTVRGYNVGRA